MVMIGGCVLAVILLIMTMLSENKHKAEMLAKQAGN